MTSGVRIGTAATTTQGMHEPEMALVGELLARALRYRGDDGEAEAVRSEVEALCSKFTPYP